MLGAGQIPGSNLVPTSLSSPQLPSAQDWFWTKRQRSCWVPTFILLRKVVGIDFPQLSFVSLKLTYLPTHYPQCPWPSAAALARSLVTHHLWSLCWRCLPERLQEKPKNEPLTEELRQHKTSRDFPGGPVVKTSPSNAEGAGSIPGQGVKFPHALGPKIQNIK